MRLRNTLIATTILVAGTLIGATTQHFASADVTSGDRPVLVPIDTCRIADTRAAPDNVGPRSTPLGPAETITVDAQQAGTDCSGQIPATATALSLNVTALNATSNSFITIWSDGQRPTASALNPEPGTRVFNAVTTEVTATQTFQIYNNRGNVDVFVDINGYYDNHNHDDRYYTETEVENLVFDGTIPSGVTVTGNLIWDSHGSTDTFPDRLDVAFPGRAPVPLVDTMVNFNQPGVTGDGDPLCQGSGFAPTAPAGKVCIYLVNSSGMATNQLFGNAGYPLADAGFQLAFFPNGTDNVNQFVAASWAYTAP